MRRPQFRPPELLHSNTLSLAAAVDFLGSEDFDMNIGVFADESAFNNNLPIREW